MSFDLLDYFLFFSIAFLGGFIDSIAGGGGLICIPGLFAMGLPPHLALGTNKLQGCFSCLIAAINYSRKGLVNFKEIFIGIVFTFIGAIFGTFAVLKIEASVLKLFIPFLLIGIFLYTIFSPNLGEIDRKPVFKKNVFYVLFGLILGFYDGFFGAGAGSFWTFALVSLIGLKMKNAVAQTKILNFTSNIVSLFMFIINSSVIYKIGLLMAVAQMISGYLGSSLVIKKDVKFVKTIFLIVVALTIVKVLYDFFFKA